LAITTLLQSLAKKKVKTDLAKSKKTLKAVVQAVEAQWDDTDDSFKPVPVEEKLKIKKTVALNLQTAEIYPEGRALIQQAKNE